MIHSMTGYGQVKEDAGEISVTIELKALNSKYFDLNLRLPKEYSGKEMEFRSILSKELGRGKIYLSLNIEYLNPEKQKKNLNKDLAKLYYDEINDLAGQLGISTKDILPTIMTFPDVLESREKNDLEEDWQIVRGILMKTITEFKDFRIKEGESLKKELLIYEKNIRNLMGEVEGMKDERVTLIRERFRKKIEELKNDFDIDPNRMEQEIIYYIEKLDITEELVRLVSHLDYFLETLKESGSGKKLNFISQEMGREINTIGSKANHTDIQKKVVAMKDELEKIKEQLQNIL